MPRFRVSLPTLILLLSLACHLTAPVTPPASPTANPYALWQSQPNPQLVFLSRADAPEGELYLIDKTGTITRLTHNQRHENNPALSNDGTRVAYNAGEESDPLTWEIYLLDLATLRETRLTDNHVLDAHPAWSPDDARLVFGSFRDASGDPAPSADIYLINTDGSNLTRLTASPWEDNDPAWSPDGRLIAFKSNRHTQQAGREEIYIMAADGSDPRRLTTTNGWGSDHDPSWSPTGDRILFTRFEGTRSWLDAVDFAPHWQELTPWNIHRVDLAGHLERLTDSPDSGWGLGLYNQTGDAILYSTIDWIFDENSRLVGGLHRLWLANPDGSGRRQLLPDDRHTGTLEYFDW